MRTTSESAPRVSGPPIDTRRVAERRALAFTSLDDILTDAETLAAAPRLRALGNWTLGQALAHLAAGMRLSVDGAQLRVSWGLRLLGPWLKHRFLRKNMPAGFRLTGEAARALEPPADAAVESGLAALRVEIARLRTQGAHARHMVLGKLTPEEWVLLHLRHAELHLSFFRVDD